LRTVVVAGGLPLYCDRDLAWCSALVAQLDAASSRCVVAVPALMPADDTRGLAWLESPRVRLNRFEASASCDALCTRVLRATCTLQLAELQLRYAPFQNVQFLDGLDLSSLTRLELHYCGCLRSLAGRATRSCRSCAAWSLTSAAA